MGADGGAAPTASQTAVAGLLTEKLGDEIAAGLSVPTGVNRGPQSTYEETEAFDGFFVCRCGTATCSRRDSTEKNWKRIIDALWENARGLRLRTGGCGATGRGHVRAVAVGGGVLLAGRPVRCRHLCAGSQGYKKHAEKVFRQETQTVDRLWRKRMMGLLQGSFPNYAMASLDNAVEVLYGDNF